MLLKDIPNLGWTADGAPLFVDTQRDLNIFGTRLCANAMNPIMQELWNAISGMGVTPGSPNTQLLSILQEHRDNLSSLSNQITQETSDRKQNSTSDKQEIQGLIDQNSTAISGLNQQMATLEATTDSFNSNISQQIENTQAALNTRVTNAENDLAAADTRIDKLSTINAFREVSLAAGNTSVTHDFSQQACLIIDIGDATLTYGVNAQATDIMNNANPVMVHARLIVTGIAASTTFQVNFNGNTYKIDMTELGDNAKIRQYSVTFANNGKAYCAEFLP